MSFLPKIFKNYLEVEGYSSTTIRNYLSDLNHFLSWLELKIKSRNLPYFQNEKENISSYFTPKIAQEYKNFLYKNNLPPATINRRLSSLRVFAKFSLIQKWILENPTKNLKNEPLPKTETKKILEKFREFLKKEKTSSNTIKNYLSDIKAFLTWLEFTS